MKKLEIIKQIAKTTGQPIGVVQNIFDTSFEVLRDTLLSGESFVIERFMGFKPFISAPRIGRNPLTGETVSIPPTLRIKTKLALSLKNELKNAPKSVLNKVEKANETSKNDDDE